MYLRKTAALRAVEKSETPLDGTGKKGTTHKISPRTAGAPELCPGSGSNCKMGEGGRDSSDVLTLFGELLVPSPFDEDGVDRARSFVVNRRAGLSLCSALERNRFFALAGDVQLSIVSKLLKGLRAGHCSTVRLRLSCKNGKLIGSLLGLLKGLTDATTGGPAAGGGDEHRSAGQHETGDLIQILGKVLGLVCSAGVEVDELKDILRELRVPSALTPPLLDALAVMARGSSNTGAGRSGNHEALMRHGAGGAMPNLFDFGGDGAGLVLPVGQWPFAQEYQIVAWIRMEEQSAASRRTKAHLVTFKTARGAGADYYIQVLRSRSSQRLPGRLSDCITPALQHVCRNQVFAC